MKSLTTPLFMGATLLMAITTTAQAQPGPHSRIDQQFQPRGMLQVQRILNHVDRMAETLGVSETQLDQMFALVDAQRASVRNLMREARQLRQELKAATEPDEVTALAQQIGQQTADLIVIGHQLRSDVLAILTEQQRQQLQSLRQERRERFRSRHG